MIKFKVKEESNFTVVNFDLEGSVAPDILEKVNLPKVNSTKGVVLSGRGPIWLYCFLFHFYHPTPFIAIYDPRLGAVVTASHNQEYKVGEIIRINVDEIVSQI
ncbi:MAG: CRISPR-associated ring nuclease Crn3/Csx3 [Candidatus Bathyarchaeota archaeon]|nr:CRISPR-associated ring nuclease Crn3/Csx3 [Candidatus Bathyarchaeota archaeon]